MPGYNASHVRKRQPAATKTSSSRTQSGGFYLGSALVEVGGGAGYAVDGTGDMDEGCLLLFLVILAVMLIIGSLVIPHFWALTTFLFLVIMAMAAYREWRFEEYYQKCHYAFR